VVWIFGGGFIQGLNADPRYNLTFIVANAVKMGKPIVAASINYRLGGWGFLEAPVIRDAGLSNIGLYDQRLALHWVQENIAAFSGDPTKVTIWGQSAGGASVGAHTVAFGGRNDSLFRGAIAHSGGPNGFQPPTAARSLATFNSILNLTGCANATDSIACLRKVPTATYTSAVNGTSGSYGPVVDGVWFETVNSEQTSEGNFLRVPLLLGNNADEGTNFAGGAPYIGGLPTTSYNTSGFLSTAAGYVRNASASDGAVAALSVLYPDIPAIGVPHSHHGRLNATFGAAYARVATLAGDMSIHRGRRLSAQMWAKYGVPVYSYDFTAWPIGGLDDFVGTTHFTEIQLAFDNENGDGYLAPWYKSGSEFAGQGQALIPLARLMSTFLLSEHVNTECIFC
jgi:carboxylesterase type B